MVIYKYNLKKYMRTVSTWILLAIAIALVGLLTWVISQTPKDNNDVTADQKFILYKLSISQSFTYVGMIILVMVVIFAAFKSVQLFRDEINEGSLLLVISKPISRRRVLQQKWMALLSVFFIFIIPVVIVHTGILLMYMKPHSLHKEIYLGFFSEIGVSLILFILFSSLFLMISLKLGVKSILGISFAFVVLLFVSQSLQTLTYVNTFKLENGKVNDGIFGPNGDNTSVFPAGGGDEDYKEYNPKYYSFQKDTSTKNPSDSYKAVPKIYSKIKGKNKFGKVWPLALNYQVSQLNSVLFDKDFIGNISTTPMRVKSSQNFDFSTTKNKFYIDQSSRDITTSLITYLNTHSSIWNKNKTTLIKDMKDFTNSAIDSNSQTLESNILSTNNNITYIPSSIVNFVAASTKSADYQKDANTLYDINNQLTNWYKTYKFRNMTQPTKGDFKDNNNLNSLFGTLASYYLTNESFAKLGLNKLNFNDSMNFTYSKLVDASILFFSDDVTSPENSLDNSHGMYYESWVNSEEYNDKFLDILNSHNDNKIKISNWTELNQYFYTVDYVNYANPYAVLVSYLVVIAVITPLTYRMFRKSDFS